VSEAEQWYSKAHRTAPNDPMVRIRYAGFLSSVGRLEDAAEQYEAAAALASGDHEIAVKTATALRKAGRMTDSEMYYRRAATLYPQVSCQYTWVCPKIILSLHLLVRNYDEFRYVLSRGNIVSK